MLGPEGVARALVTRLREMYPIVLAGFRERYGVDDVVLPEVENIYPAERSLVDIEGFPAIFVTELDTTGKLDTRMIESAEEGDLYLYKYRMRVFVWVVSDSTDSVDLLRKRLVLATREALLANKILHDAGGQYAELDANTLRESFSDTVAGENRELLGGAYLEMEIATQEHLAAWPGPIGAGVSADVALSDT